MTVESDSDPDTRPAGVVKSRPVPSIEETRACDVIRSLPVFETGSGIEDLGTVADDLDHLRLSAVPARYHFHAVFRLPLRKKSYANLGVVAGDCLGEEGAHSASNAVRYPPLRFRETDGSPSALYVLHCCQSWGESWLET